MNRMLLGYNPDFDAFDAAPLQRETEGKIEPVFDNVDTMSLAIDLLEVTSMPQLGPAMRRIVRRAGESAGKPLDEPVASALSDLLENAARHALPRSRTAATVPADAGMRARGRLFGLELEGLSPEDQEFETVKAFVRFAGEAVRRAGSVSQRLSPHVAAQLAALQSARRLAPGWLRMNRSASWRTATGPKGSNPGAVSASTS